MPRSASKLSHALGYALAPFVVGVAITAIAFQFLPAGSNLTENSFPFQSDSADTRYQDFASGKSESIGTTLVNEGLDNVVDTKTLDDILQLSSEFDQNLALYHRLALSDEVGVKNLLEESKSMVHASQRDAAQRMIFERFAAINPSEALSYVSQFNPIQHRVLVDAIFREWSHSDLVAASDATKHLPSTQRNLAISAILRSRDDLPFDKLSELAKNLGGEKRFWYIAAQSEARTVGSDPRTAFSRAANSTVKDVISREKLKEIAILWVEAEGTRVLGEINGLLTDNPFRRDIIRSLVVRFASTEPEAILSFLEEMPQQDSVKRLTSLVYAYWVLIDVHAAFASATDFDLADSTNKHRAAVISYWVRSDPQAVLDLVDSLPSQLKTSSMKRALLSMLLKTPTQVVSYLEDIQDAQLRSELVSSVGRRWAEIDPHAATDWILSLPIEITKDDLKSIVVAKLARQDPQLAVKLAAKQEGKLALRMERFIMSSITATDIDKAIDILPRISIENQIEGAVQIGNELIKHDPQRALDLGDLLNENQRAEYFPQLIDSWARNEPFRLISMLDDLPSKQLTSTAAYRIIRENWHSGSLTIAQFDHVYSRLNAEHQAAVDRYLRRPYPH